MGFYHISQDRHPLNLQNTLLPAGTSPGGWHVTRDDVDDHLGLLSPSVSRLNVSNDGIFP